MTEPTKAKLQLKLYLVYENYANLYASKVFNYERFSYEKEDVIQELKIKIYNCIGTYLKKWQQYKATGRYKPVPLKYYLKTAMNNRTKDFIKLLNKECVENCDKISIQSNEYDEGIYSNMDSVLDLKKSVAIINDVDLFHKLEDKERKCFALFLQGWKINKLQRMFRSIDLGFIDEQVQYLRLRTKDLYNFNTIHFKTFNMAEQE